MEHTFNFLRPLTPEPSFDDLLNEFSLTQQHGEGVVTRRQARLAETQPSAAEISSPSDPVLDLETENPEPGQSSAPEPPAQPQPNSEVADVDKDVDDDDATSADDETAPYLKDTLVAQNDLLEAHVIKTHFRRMKNFS